MHNPQNIFWDKIGLKNQTPFKMIFQLVQAKAYYTVESHSGNNRKANGSQ